MKFKVGDEVFIFDVNNVYIVMEVDLNDDNLPYRLNKKTGSDWYSEIFLTLATKLAKALR